MMSAAFSRVVDHLRVVDPGLMRLRIASRSASSCTLTGAVGIGWSVLHRQPPTLAALGILFAMIAPLFLREPRRADWYASLLSIYLGACASFALAIRLAPHARLADGCFVAILFAGILCQACGTRVLGCAMTGFVTYYLGLYLHPAPAQALAMLALSVAGPVMVTLVARRILPAHAARTRRLALRTVTLRARRVLALRRDAPAAARDGALSALNEAALAVEEHVCLLGDADAWPIRERLVELEVAAGQLAGGTGAGSAGHEVGNAAGSARLTSAIARLEQGERLWDTLALAPAVSPLPARQRWADLRARLAWRHALRAGSAAVIAMAIGHALSPERWFWAVITIFVVFLGTRSRADTLYRGMERLAGTLAGALTSAVLATALHASPVLMVVAMVLCVFGWAYYILTTYSRGVFFITVLVGLVYAELGFAIRPLVATRIEEVLVGCLVSFAVAFLLMPLTATRHIDTRLLAVLRALRASVQASTVGRAGTAGQPGAAMRRLDRSWQDLRIAWRPMRTQRVFAWQPGRELALGALFACLHAARELSRLATVEARPMPGEAATDATQAGGVDAGNGDDAHHARHLDAILRRLDALIDVYAADGGNGPRRPGDALAAMRGLHDLHDLHDAAHAPRPADMTPGALPSTAGRASALAQLDGAIRLLSERLSRVSTTPSGRESGFVARRVQSGAGPGR